MAQDPFKLDVYNMAYELSLDIFKEAQDFKQFRVRDQLIGSATSVAANLGELGAFDNINQILQKVITCIGECNETQFWLNFCVDVGLIEENKKRGLINKNKALRMSLINLKKNIIEEKKKREYEKARRLSNASNF